MLILPQTVLLPWRLRLSPTCSGLFALYLVCPLDAPELFAVVRHNYFRLYFHYINFNIARIFYLQVDNLFGLFLLFLLFPSIVAGIITLGLMAQIIDVLEQVRSSFQYLIYS